RSASTRPRSIPRWRRSTGGPWPRRGRSTPREFHGAGPRQPARREASGLGSGQETPVGREVRGDHGSDTESLHGGTRIRPHAIAEVSIREESAYPGSERRHVAGRDEITRPAILDQLLVAPHSGRDRGDAARHVLKQGVREPLGFGAEEADAEVFHDGDYVRQAPEQMQERAHA